MSETTSCAERAESAPGEFTTPDAAALDGAGAALVTAEGEIARLDAAALARRLDGPPLLVCHARSLAQLGGRRRIAAFDVLELFAFTHPARFCLPTPSGLAAFLGLPAPRSAADGAAALYGIAERLLQDLARAPDARDAARLAWRMGQAGWPWAPQALAALGRPASEWSGGDPFAVWKTLPEWQGEPPPPPPGAQPIAPGEATRRLALLRGATAEARPQQEEYSEQVAAAFAPRQEVDAPVAVLAEAGTGVGKTLGYLAPASLWAERNEAPVWISTYTRNLQRQIDQELDRLYPDPGQKARRTVTRKGRENYLCLLNLEEAARTLATRPQGAVALGLITRWAVRTRDGDLTGGDLPGWLPGLLGVGRSMDLADRRGECIYSACPHHRRCFIEHSQRRARKAEIVVANHALVMAQAALGGDEGGLPTRIVFDEGHHLFDAADSAFAAHLTGRETAELRRWLIGSEASRRTRSRGLRRRVEDLLGEDDQARETLDEIERAARALPGEGWAGRLRPDSRQAGAVEAFLARVRAQVYARASGRDAPYGLEAPTEQPVDELLATADALRDALTRLVQPMRLLAKALADRLDRDAAELDSAARQRIDAAARGLKRRADHQVMAWIAMLDTLIKGEADAAFVDWFGVERVEAGEIDTGYYRHYLDPTLPFIRAISPPTHGMAVTSATLNDGNAADDWEGAEIRTGARHLLRPALRGHVASPFAYERQTRILIVTDVRKTDPAQVAAAYRTLFLAAGGGALGLFTAISRLRETHARIAAELDAAGLPLLAQHVDGMDTGTLVDMFRADETACLLGTDAVRDGVDVPGRSLRLIVFDRVPWPRQSILERARRKAFGGAAYTDRQVRLKLKQAYGRLIRRADDKGVFVILDSATPSRLHDAFPAGAPVERVGLAEAAALTTDFLAYHAPAEDR